MKRYGPYTIRALLAGIFCLAFTLGCQVEPLAEVKEDTPKISRNDDPKQLLKGPLKILSKGYPADVDRELIEALENVHTNPGDIPRLKVAVDGEKLDLPLKHTHVKTTITGYVAEVEVTQSYENPFDYPIEAIYIFPLPENAAVNDMKMIIGDRVIEALIKEREDARRTYEQAVQDGHTASLLEQERPNVFTQSVANIAPNTGVDVKIRYVQNLTYDAGEYEFVFPMVVGPRFIPGGATGSKTGTGWAQDTNEVPDASRITPALLGGGLRSGHDISLEVVADAGFPVMSFEVPTHKVIHTPTSDGSLSLKLSKSDTIPNRDFVLKFAVAAKEPQATLLTHSHSKDGYFSLIVQPPDLDIEKHVGKREIIFVVDVSGSMSGIPLAMCKDAMEEAIGGLRPVDTFNVVTFESRTGKAFDKPRPANDVNVNQALEFVSGMRAGGGTRMGLGVQAAFANDVEQGRHRYILFMTDGYIGNEAGIMSMTRQFVTKLDAKGHRARVFAMGIGSSTNRYLLDGIANAGDGLAVYTTNREEPAQSIDKVFSYIDHPVIEDIEIDWGGMTVSDVYPENPGVLFASRPIIVQGRFNNNTSNRPKISIRGSSNGREVSIPVETDLHKSGSMEVQKSLWARAKVDWLEKSLIYDGRSEQTIDQITELGLSHRLVTAYTSLVAVDNSLKVKGKLHTISQPVEIPEGVNPEMAANAGILAYAPAPQARPVRKAPRGQMGKRDKSKSAGGNYGYGGLGIVGTGRGGGGTGEGTIGLGALSTVGHGGGGGSGSGYGRGAGGLGSKSTTPRIRTGKAIVTGSLSTEIIRRFIRRHNNETRFCYEKELKKHPDLNGTIMVRFVISADGSVTGVTISHSTVKNTDIENCLLKAIKRWTFPPPSDGGVVIVKMPFKFTPPKQ